MKYETRGETCDVWKNAKDDEFPDWLEEAIERGDATMRRDSDTGAPLGIEAAKVGEDEGLTWTEYGDYIVLRETDGEMFVFDEEEFKALFVLIPQNAKERLMREMDDTSERYTKLCRALKRVGYEEHIGHDEWVRQIKQKNIMEEYLNVLRERLASWREI